MGVWDSFSRVRRLFPRSCFDGNAASRRTRFRGRRRIRVAGEPACHGRRTRQRGQSRARPGRHDLRCPGVHARAGIDFSKVNVRVQSGGGTTELSYVHTADRCDPVTGGWHYDVDPATAAPSRVIVCEATCKKYKTDATAKVDLLFGCKTRTID
jgi:hypothetical protein